MSTPHGAQEWGLATRAVHAGEARVDSSFQPTSTPVYNASGFFMPSFDELDEVFAGTRDGYFYTRNGNPTVRAFEGAMASLEGCEDVVAFGSGMAAIHAAVVATGLKAGDRLVATRDCYGLTRVLFDAFIRDMGVEIEWIDMNNRAAVREALSSPPRVVYLESITNPLVKVPDLVWIVDQARSAGSLVVVDNTFASPYLLRPIEHGVDLVVHSATKYIGGHGDVTAGTVAVGNPTLAPRLRQAALVLGAILGPNEAWLAHRGLKTLPLRLARQCDNAIEIALWLSEHPLVAHVNFPGLPNHADRAVASALFGGRFGAMLSFDIRDGDRQVVRRFMDALALIAPAPTLGDLRSLTLYPALASHRGLSAEERHRIGIGDGLVRLSVGVEEPADVMADLDHALRAAGG